MAAAPDFQLFTSLRYDPLLSTLPPRTEFREDKEEDDKKEDKKEEDKKEERDDSSATQAPPPSSSSSSSSPFYMLPYHRDRMLQAATHFDWPAAAASIRAGALLGALSEAITHTNAAPGRPLRVKALLRRDGAISVEAGATPEVAPSNLFPERIPPPAAARGQGGAKEGDGDDDDDDDAVDGDAARGVPWEVVPDTVRTAPSAYTSYKTTRREVYAAARARAGIRDLAEKREVLMVSEREGEIMEASLTSVFFWREGRWTTPPVASGGQRGTTRRWALEKGLAVEGPVKLDSLLDGEECWISNGVRGFQCGKIKLP